MSLAPYTLSTPDPPVAVLIGPQTASSGEATALSFKGRPNTQFFGQPTAGFTPANRTFKLSDGAVLVLIVSWMTDRNGEKYPNVTPDEPGSSPEDTQQKALDWLRAQPTCQGR